MKANIGMDDESGLVHSVVGTDANVADVTQVDKLLHGTEHVVCADAGYTGIEKRTEHDGREVIWQIAARCSLTRSWVSVAFYTKPSARSTRPRPRYAPKSSTRFGRSSASSVL